MTARRIALVLAALAAVWVGLAAACGKGKAEPSAAAGPSTDQSSAALKAQGTDALPGETRVVVGLSAPKIAASPLARRLVADLLGRDADAEQRLVDLLGRCKIDPEKDVESLTIGMAEGQDLGLLVRGKLDEKALAECVRAETTSTGGTFVDQQTLGRTVYVATSKEGGQKVFFTFAPDKTLIVALSDAWLQKILDPKSPKLDGTKEMVALLGRVSKDAAVWGTGFLPAGVGKNLVEVTGGQVTQPAESVAFEATFDKGLVGTLRLDMKGATDAEKLAAFVKGQLDWLAVAAQKYSIGPIVAKIQVVSEQASVKISVHLDDTDVKTLEAALAKSEKKEQSK
jgi:hypothetical protein